MEASRNLEDRCKPFDEAARTGTEPPGIEPSGTATAPSGRRVSQDQEARWKRVLDYQADVLEKENHLDAVLGTINAGLMGITIQLDEFLERALANPKTVDQVRRLLPFLQTYLQVARQVDRFAQLELRLTASRKANSADSAN